MADAETLDKIHCNVTFPHIGDDYFSNKEYLNLFPDNKNWIQSELNIDDSKSYDPCYLNEFRPTDYNADYPYYNTLQAAFDLYHKWRSLEHNENGWKSLKEKKNIGFQAWWKSIPNGTISAIKAQMTIPYPVPIIIGIILNNIHLSKYNKNMGRGYGIQNMTKQSCVYHQFVPRPIPFISSRYMIVLQSVYVLPNCEVLFIERSIDSHPKDKHRNNKKFVRGDATLHVWHIRPDYNAGKHTNSVVTEYAHGNPNGSIPSWLIDQLIELQATCIISLKQYIDSIKDTLHKPGVLNIPFPLLKEMKVFKDKLHMDQTNEDVKYVRQNEVCSVEREKVVVIEKSINAIEKNINVIDFRKEVLLMFKESFGGYVCLLLVVLCSLGFGIWIGTYLSFEYGMWCIGVILAVVVALCLFYGIRIYYIYTADYREYYQSNKHHFE